ncbi:ABC transporter ATP-binding protein [Corallibacter sp.]|uniref:ABC transporter ATP-binding protein n=1 Tax=Corallibacter sp. TaxID=2038084 RepID=UPI003AB8616E
MLQVKNIYFSYKDTPVLKNINFSIKQGEHLSIIGESGSGKSTLLKLIHGEYDLLKGDILWKDQEILGPKYNLVIGYDFVKYVAQEFELMPFISVEENIGKFLSNFYPNKKRKRIKELLDVVELNAFSKTKVKDLSGGQKQRVALARALAKEPEIILMDEPFSHIDSFKKQSLRRRLFNYLKEKNISCIVATHDKEDVLGYADTMLVLSDAKVLAYNTPQTLYNKPNNALIASFFNEYNIINNTIVYANELIITEEKSDIVAIVTQSYFKGYYYLIEAKINNDIIFFEAKFSIKKGAEIALKIIKSTL